MKIIATSDNPNDLRAFMGFLYSPECDLRITNIRINRDANVSEASAEFTVQIGTDATMRLIHRAMTEGHIQVEQLRNQESKHEH